MSIQDEINRLSQNVADTYSALGDMGATLPETQNSDNMANTVRTIPQSGGNEASSLRVTATAQFTSESDGILVGMSSSFAEIEAAYARGEYVYIDIDIGQASPNQKIVLPLVSYINESVVLFGGSINTTAEVRQSTAILNAEGDALLFINILATIEDINNTTLKVTADYTPSIGTDGIIITVANLSPPFAGIKAAFDSGKDIKLIGKQAVGSTNDHMLFNFVTINDVQAIFSTTAFLNGAFLLIGLTVNADGSTSCIVKTI